MCYVMVCVCVCTRTVYNCVCVCYSSLGPPAVNKPLVYEWHRTVARLHSQLQEVHNKFLVQLQNSQEVVNMTCISEVERHRVRLYHVIATPSLSYICTCCSGYNQGFHLGIIFFIQQQLCYRICKQ